jgi:hypothetical protein
VKILIGFDWLSIDSAGRLYKTGDETYDSIKVCSFLNS